jgi:hypothetical protein
MSIAMNMVAIDWLTLTSKRNKSLLNLANLFLPENIYEAMLAKRMQYQGTVFNNVFYGVSRDGRTDMLQASQYEAHLVYDETCRDDRRVMNCTRVDIQFTVPLDQTMDAYFAHLCDCRSLFKDKTGKGLSWSMIMNEDNRNTLYIGSRQSDVYRRVYVKEIEKQLWLRFEVEYKGNQAQLFWSKMGGNDYLTSELTRGFEFLKFSKLDKEFDYLVSLFPSKGDGTVIELPVKPVINWEWIYDTVLPYLRKASDIDYDRTSELLDVLTTYHEKGVLGNSLTVDELLENIDRR